MGRLKPLVAAAAFLLVALCRWSCAFLAAPRFSPPTPLSAPRINAQASPHAVGAPTPCAPRSFQAAGVAGLAAATAAVLAVALGGVTRRSKAQPRAPVGAVSPMVGASTSLLAGEAPMLRKGIVPIRGGKEEAHVARKAWIRRGDQSVVKHEEKILKYARGYWQTMNERYPWRKQYTKRFRAKAGWAFKTAVTAVMDMMKWDRMKRIRLYKWMKELWLIRVSANCKLHGMQQSYFKEQCQLSNIRINRKMMAQLGVYDRKAFTAIVETAVPDWKEQKMQKDSDRLAMSYTAAQIDEKAIPMIERKFPQLYSSPNVRFNRKVHTNPSGAFQAVQYTIDVGNPEVWQNTLAKTPELANFNLPDHWIENANRMENKETYELAYLSPPDDYITQEYKNMYNALKEQEAAAIEMREQGDPKAPKLKEGVDRKSWFERKPQSWFKE